MKITIYTITDCQFSKQEKEYLTAHNLQYEEKSLETNKDFLTEMLAVSNNFAGTPVTRVEKDDGSIAVLKGFTKEEFDTTFGFATAPTTPTANPQPSAVVNDTPIQPKTDLTDSTDSTDSTVTPDPLKSVMDDLEAKAQPTEVQPTPPPAETPPAPTEVTQPPANTPSIPDFPADGKTSV